jgi:hypothetical protein
VASLSPSDLSVKTRGTICSVERARIRGTRLNGVRLVCNVKPFVVEYRKLVEVGQNEVQSGASAQLRR